MVCLCVCMKGEGRGYKLHNSDLRPKSVCLSKREDFLQLRKKKKIVQKKIFDNSSRAWALAVGAGGIVWSFFLFSIIFLSSLFLRETVPCRLKYCLKGPFNPKQPINLK